ncbi:hypothetical protein [Sphingomonas zeae]
MVAILDKPNDRVMSPEEYRAFVEENVDVFDYESLVETAWSLRCLANDRGFVLKHYHDEVVNVINAKGSMGLSPQSVYLVHAKDFFIRANLWLPPSRHVDLREKEKALFSYSLPHDHNFDFVTVGYYGVGYETDLYEYEADEVVGYIGEGVGLVPTGRERLTPGKVMVYKANADVHTQHEPETVSLSLNLMPLNPRTWTLPQYAFDVDEHRINGGVSDQTGSRLFLLDFFRTINDADSVQVLSDLMQRHPCARTRGTALNVLEEIAPKEREYFRRVAPTGTHRYNRPDLVSAGDARQREQA